MPSGKRVNAAPGGGRAPSTNRPKPRPKLGQNFLADRGAAQRIVAALGDVSQQRVLEIGPGRGALTAELAQRAGSLIAIELDRVLAAQLRMKFANRPNVEIIEADILTIDLANLLGPRVGMLAGLSPAPLEPARVVGNIPYYITSDILLRLFSFHRMLSIIVIMVQKEVADRIAAQPGGSEYGLLSATAQMYARVEKLFSLPPGAFVPPPAVHSTVLRLTIAPQFERLQVAEQGFLDFLRLSFAQKRKTLLNNLKARYEDAKIRAALKSAGVRADARAETLPLDKAAAIFRALS
jgi:16S rRNA (adenine1518-N6/adenine1519-N6)-dimethyltransferase